MVSEPQCEAKYINQDLTLLLLEQAKYAERTYDQYANTYFERIPYPSASGIKTVLESLVKENPKAKGADPSSFVDASILKSLEDSGFIKSLYE